MSTTEELEHLFSYGTLQNEAVQLATFGRKLMGEPDTLLGCHQTRIEIQDPSVVATSGATYYLNARKKHLLLENFLVYWAKEFPKTKCQALVC